MSTKKRFIYEQYENNKDQYIVLSPEGFDLLGEWVPLAEAEAIVNNENFILDLLENKELITLSDQLRDANETPAIWLDELLHHPDVMSTHLRALKRRPTYLKAFLAWIEKQEEKHQTHLIRQKAIHALDHQAIKYKIANLLEAPVTIMQVEFVFSLLFKYNDLNNIKEMATNPMFLEECITAIISEAQCEK